MPDDTTTLSEFFSDILHESAYNHPLGKKISELLTLLTKELPPGQGVRGGRRWHRLIVVWETLPTGFPNVQGPELRIAISGDGWETTIPLRAEMFSEPLETIVGWIEQQLPGHVRK